jgi:hypothetical protein
MVLHLSLQGATLQFQSTRYQRLRKRATSSLAHAVAVSNRERSLGVGICD